MNNKFILIVFFFAVLVNFSDAQESEEENDEDVFIATHEWQTIKEGKTKNWRSM